MGSFCSVRGAWPLALLVFHLLGDAASTHSIPLVQDAEHPWNDVFWAHEADEVSAAIAKRVVAAGYTYGYARRWLAERFPRRGMNGTVDGITKRCYARGLRSLEKQVRPRPPPPPTPQESPEDEARRYVLQILRTTGTSIPVYPWPITIVNPVIRSRQPRL